MRIAVLLATASLLVAGCGSDTGAADGGAADGGGGGGTSVGDGDTQLTVVLRTGPGQGKQTFDLTCDPPGGDHPDPVAACALLEELKKPFAPVPPRTACTEIYGGPQRARVTGELDGDAVDTEFSRTNGCEIARWDAHADLLVESGGVGAS